MAYETIVAVFDSAEHAEEAVRDLETAGIPGTAISRHAGRDTAIGTTSTTTAPRSEPGFWARLFGEEPAYEREGSMYDQSLELGSTVITVKVLEEQVIKVTDILDRHNPIDLDERGDQYGTDSSVSRAGVAPLGNQARSGRDAVVGSAHTDTDTGDSLAGGLPAGVAAGAPDAGAPGVGVSGVGVSGVGARTSGGETIPLSEESISVGKRSVNRGTTRVRRYVVEKPVEETVALRDEHVTVDRRPVSGGDQVTRPDFSEKVIEVSETTEEPVVSKSARVREEVVINKRADERTETVRDTVRREDVEITKDPGSAATTDPVRR